MTKIVFYKFGDSFWGFEEQGHAGLDVEGEDILCASLSAITMFVVNAIEVVYASDVKYEVDEDAACIRVSTCSTLPEFEADEKKRYAISGLFTAHYNQLKLLLEEFPDLLKVDVVEKKYEHNN